MLHMLVCNRDGAYTVVCKGLEDKVKTVGDKFSLLSKAEFKVYKVESEEMLLELENDATKLKKYCM